MTTTFTDNFFNNINSEYFNFTTSEKKVADYILNHKSTAQYMSISELAFECNVAEATISRFCRHLKFTNYNKFKLALAKSTVTVENIGEHNQEEKILQDDTIDIVCKKIYTKEIAALAQGLSSINTESIENAVDLLYSSNKVLCLGQGASSIMAQEATHIFSTISNKFLHISDSHMQTLTISTLNKNDVILFFSYSMSTKELMDLLSLANNNGIKTILITRYLKSPCAELADITLQCGLVEDPLHLDSIPARLTQLYIIDILYNEYIKRDIDSAKEIQEKIVEALSHKHL